MALRDENVLKRVRERERERRRREIFKKLIGNNDRKPHSEKVLSELVRFKSIMKKINLLMKY